MTTDDLDTPPQQSLDASVSPDGKFDPILTRIDLVAIVTALVGTCLLTLTVAVLAVVQAVKLILTLWSNSLDRWLFIAVCVALIWVVARWKRSHLS
jgi:hypothetical protein